MSSHKHKNDRFSRVGLIALISLLSFSPALAAAQSTTLDAFRPAPAPHDGFAISSTESPGRLRLSAQLYLEYANDPLVFEQPGTEARIVANHLVFHGLFALALRDRALVFVGVPVNALMNGDAPGARPVFGADGAGMGDVHVGARASFYGDPGRGLSLAAQGSLYFPTSQLGGEQHYAGDRTLRLHAQVLGQYKLESVRIALNLGLMFRGRQHLPGGLDVGQQLTFGVGASVPLLDETLSLIGEVHGSTTLNDAFDREQTSLELVVGGRYHHASGLRAGVGAGPGLAHGFGTPDFRVLGTIGYARELDEASAPEPRHDADGDGIADGRDACPNEPEDDDGFQDDDGCPDLDDDGDGVPDTSDACRSEPEDVDGFEDENGCPDPDDDRDGVLDASDACRSEPEDLDGFEDADGCPDLDDDGDGVPDTSDRCREIAGPASNHGCPEPDRDGDTLIDRLDNCPDEAGSVENQGCANRQQVRIEEGRLVILDTVYFRSNSDVIQPRSFGLLDNVASVILAHPEIARVRVEGHTDARGNHDRNVTLSQARAESVKRYLVSRGIEVGRLHAVGFGPDRPVVPNARTAAEHTRNRRVEFNLEDAEPSATETPANDAPASAR